MLLSSCERTQTFAVQDERDAEKTDTFTQPTVLWRSSSASIYRFAAALIAACVGRVLLSAL
jgi:hypothetical protein